MHHATEHLIRTLTAARGRAGVSQREVGKRAGVPQSHISKIENGLVDPQVTTLVELGRALGLELTWVPRKAIPAVTAIVRAIDSPDEESTARPAYELGREDE